MVSEPPGGLPRPLGDLLGPSWPLLAPLGRLLGHPKWSWVLLGVSWAGHNGLGLLLGGYCCFNLGSLEAALELFARPSDWTKWEDDAVPMSEKILCARDLLWDLDMVRPSEQMKARVANLLRYRACG